VDECFERIKQVCPGRQRVQADPIALHKLTHPHIPILIPIPIPPTHTHTPHTQMPASCSS
jgi:hypothetical protein